jgi:hypothetical protein
MSNLKGLMKETLANLEKMLAEVVKSYVRFMLYISGHLKLLNFNILCNPYH